MEVMRPEAGVAFGAFSLSSLVSGFQAREAKDVKALGEDGVLALYFARRTRHHFLVFLQLFREDFVGGRRHLELLHPLHLLAKVVELLGGAPLFKRLFHRQRVLLAHGSLKLFQLRGSKRW